MKIIDFERRGNLVRFLIGDDEDDDFWGEDWNERPYDKQQNNRVYDGHITGYRDVVFPFDAIVCELCDGHTMSRRSKRDMKGRRCACIAVIFREQFDEDEYDWLYEDDFDIVVSDGRSTKFFFGDTMEPSEDIIIYNLEQGDPHNV